MTKHRFYFGISALRKVRFLAYLFPLVLVGALAVSSMAGTTGMAARAVAVNIQVLVQGNSRTFPETGQTVAGNFHTYWNEHGALAQQGFPISPEMQEVSAVDGKEYTVQYF